MESIISKEHHTYLLEGERGVSLAKLRRFLEEDWGFATNGNLDYFEKSFETFKIDDARLVQKEALTRPVGEKKIFVLAMHFATGESQNALLKLLEEAGDNTYFFIISPSLSIFLPTVSSRAISIKIHERTGQSGDEVKSFLRGGFDVRQKIMKPFMDHDNESKKSDLLVFLGEIEKELYTKKEDSEVSFALNEIIKMKEYLYMRSPSVKMIGEYLALIIPKSN